MKVLNIFVAAMMVAVSCVGSTDAATVKLPRPSHSCGTSFDEALKQRRSVRSFDASKPIDIQMLSDLLWSAAGINREDGRRTNPTALNKQEIEIYVFTPQDVCRYDFNEHALEKVADGDYRSLIADRQAFVNDAPVSLLLVADVGAFGEPSQRNMMMAMADAGIVCQNINLFCAANGLATVPRATMDTDALRKLLDLSESSVPALNNPVGYELVR